MTHFFICRIYILLVLGLLALAVAHHITLSAHRAPHWPMSFLEEPIQTARDTARDVT